VTTIAPGGPPTGGPGSDTPTSADGGEPPVVRTAVPSRRSGRGRLIGVGVVLVAAFAFLVVKGLGTSLDYYLTVDQAVHQEATLGDKDFRIMGTVDGGTVHQTTDGVDFTISNAGVSEPITFVGSPPQLFAAGIGVVLVGHFADGATVFDSNQMLIKHSSDYSPATPAQAKAEAPTSTTLR